MRLLLIRHGETDANVALMGSGATDGLYEMGGDTDVPLNKNGILQSEEAAKKLPDHIDALFSSPLLRARETARLIATEKNIPETAIIISEALTEYKMGALDGAGNEEIEKRTGVNFRTTALDCSYDYRPYGGESWEDVRDRLLPFLEELKKNYQGKTVVLATSGGIIRMAYKLLLGEIAPNINQKIKILNCSIHEFILES